MCWIASINLEEEEKLPAEEHSTEACSTLCICISTMMLAFDFISSLQVWQPLVGKQEFVWFFKQ